MTDASGVRTAKYGKGDIVNITNTQGNFEIDSCYGFDKGRDDFVYCIKVNSYFVTKKESDLTPITVLDKQKPVPVTQEKLEAEELETAGVEEHEEHEEPEPAISIPVPPVVVEVPAPAKRKMFGF